MTRLNLIKLGLCCALVLGFSGCRFWHETAKPIVSVVDDIARNMCGVFFGEQHGIDPLKAVETYCDVREKWSPWIDPALSATRMGGALATGQEAESTCECSEE